MITLHSTLMPVTLSSPELPLAAHVPTPHELSCLHCVCVCVFGAQVLLTHYDLKLKYTVYVIKIIIILIAKGDLLTG